MTAFKPTGIDASSSNMLDWNFRECTQLDVNKKIFSENNAFLSFNYFNFFFSKK
jgi:hypothetical protein